VEPALGRRFTEEDAAPGAPAVVLVSHDIWRDRLGSDPDALGRTVRVDGRPAQVVGVMPEGFGFPWNQKVWSPLNVEPAGDDGAAFTTSAESRWLVGRLRNGVSAAAAAQELTAITRQLDRETRGTAGPESTVRVARFTDLFSESGQSVVLAALLMGIAFMVLLVACANVANVLLARAIARRREIAVRLALGASRFRITAQLLAETSLLAAAGAAGGVVIALIGRRFADAALAAGMPYWIELRVDWPVLGFVALVAVLATLMAGLLPAIQASRANTHDLLKDENRGSSNFRVGRIMRRLIGVEMAVSFVLLVLAGLFARSAANFHATDYAFEPEEVYTASLRLPETTYGDAAARARFSEQIRETLGGLPQVAGIALATAVPGVGSARIVPVELEGAAEVGGEGGSRARSIVVTPGFFELFRASPVVGRDFAARDRAGAFPIAIVNEAFAREHFPEGALDRRIRYSGPEGEEEWLTIIGVTPDLMAGGIEGEIPEAVYLPLAQHPRSQLTIIARPRGGFTVLPAPIRESLAALDPDVALFRILPLEQVINLANSQYKWFSVVFAINGGIALFLAALGLYGVMAFWVIQRTREIGVRMALGGQRGDIVRLVLRQGMSQTSLGLLAGVLLAVPSAQLLSGILYGVAPYDPMVFGSILAVLITAAWFGCWVPARRATRIDPLKALVAE
jgi:predicted permease